MAPLRQADLRRELDDARRESDVRLNALLERASEIVMLVDAEGVIRYLGPSVRRILGYTVEELVDTRSFDLAHPDDVPALALVFERAVNEPGEHHASEFRVRHKDGSWRLMEATGKNMFDDPAVGGLVVTARDVTERRALESRIVQAERLEAIGQLAGGVAHDFNNVLLVIRGYSSVLRATLEDPQQISDIEEIAKAADRAAELTRQLLAFGRRQVTQPRVVSVVDVVRGVESLLRRSLREDIDFELELRDETPPVVADVGQLEQVLLNLVVNARDAIHGTGALRVAVCETEVESTAFRVAPPLASGRYVTIAVEDTGVGIDEGVLPHIFEPFFTTKEEGIGTGLGLSTVYGIVVQSGGGIEVVPRPGGGTRFAVYLPVASGALDAQTSAATAQSSLPAGTERILLVEDEAPVRELVRRVLEDAGYDVLVASRPSEAERLLEENDEIHLMVSDVVMPEMSGYDLAGRVRERRPEMLLLFMSGYAHRISGAEHAAGPLLKKPFAPEQLARAVRKVLDGDPDPLT
jgi:PAS domain S-box-containing protein